MKKTIFLILLFTISMNLSSQDLAPISLNKPNLSQGSSLMEAFQNRRSQREFSDKQLSIAEISDLLWAAYGINKDDGKRTAPTATNAQEIDVYLINADGAYFYDAANFVLQPVYKGDLRQSIAAGQDFVLAAPISILIVADISKLRGNDNDRKIRLACMDGGIVSQNIALFCAGRNLATVPRATMDDKSLREALKLKDTQYTILNHPVGYKK